MALTMCYALFSFFIRLDWSWMTVVNFQLLLGIDLTWGYRSGKVSFKTAFLQFHPFLTFKTLPKIYIYTEMEIYNDGINFQGSPYFKLKLNWLKSCVFLSYDIHISFGGNLHRQKVNTFLNSPAITINFQLHYWLEWEKSHPLFEDNSIIVKVVHSKYLTLSCWLCYIIFDKWILSSRFRDYAVCVLLIIHKRDLIKHIQPFLHITLELGSDLFSKCSHQTKTLKQWRKSSFRVTIKPHLFTYPSPQRSLLASIQRSDRSNVVLNFAFL